MQTRIRAATLQQNLGIFLSAALLSFVIAGCGDDESPTSVQPSPAQLRAIHLSPDAPRVDVFLNDAVSAAVQGLAFEQGTPYVQVQAGDYDVDIAPAGSSAADAVLSVTDLRLESGKSYTAVAYGPVGNLAALALVDNAQGLGNGMIRVRAIHTAAAVGQVDIWNIPNSGGPTVLYANVDFGVAGGYLDLPAGAYTLGIDVDNDASPDVVFALPSLAAGTVANVFAVSNGSSVFLLAQLADGTVARIDAQ